MPALDDGRSPSRVEPGATRAAVLAAADGIRPNDLGLTGNNEGALLAHHLAHRGPRDGIVFRMDVQPGHRILDVGCGPEMLWVGQIVEYLLAHRGAPGTGTGTGVVIGTDFSREAVEAAQKRIDALGLGHMAKVLHGEAEGLPVAEGTVDRILASHVSQYLPDPAHVYAQWRRYLTPGTGQVWLPEMDFGSMQFGLVPLDLQQRVIEARRLYESKHLNGVDAPFENTWVGPENALSLVKAGYVNVTQETIPIFLMQPLRPEAIRYILNMAEIMVADNPYVTPSDLAAWQWYFPPVSAILSGERIESIMDESDFWFLESEIVTHGYAPG